MLIIFSPLGFHVGVAISLWLKKVDVSDANGYPTIAIDLTAETLRRNKRMNGRNRAYIPSRMRVCYA